MLSLTTFKIKSIINEFIAYKNSRFERLTVIREGAFFYGYSG
jgi:hypothetical protein